MPHQLLPFLAVAALLTLTPGPDMALVLRNGIRGGVRTAWWTGLGCCTGIAVYAAASAVGLAAVLAASTTAFTLIKFVGAAYLIYLGVMALVHSRKGAPPTDGHGAVLSRAHEPVLGRAQAFRQGLMSNLLNPKIALIFLTLIPQFVSPGEEPFATTAVLAAAFLGMGLLWWRTFSLAVGVLGRFMASERVRTTVERVTGIVLIGLGVRVAVADH
ncbi:LysE family translocator [Nocardioides vastitatis]|uniref:LysE family translocator n=3 Tax=Nocardioides TaxID=1839 RepID=A0ABW0ZIZ8_9ACTN